MILLQIVSEFFNDVDLYGAWNLERYFVAMVVGLRMDLLYLLHQKLWYTCSPVLHVRHQSFVVLLLFLQQ